jgi:EAL domain-containing protein (putative c-di-GMP-specific phosphodiesterase class I)
VGLSFNLSAHDIASPEAIGAIIQCISASDFSPERITVELTETAVLRDFDTALHSIAALRALGMKVALDDFGTGYSSLGYLHKLTLDRVKVDRSFVSELHSNQGRNIVSAIMSLCRSLEIDCVIEGVESHEQLLRLRALGYRTMQGYLFARPMPISDLQRWLNEHAMAELMPTPGHDYEPATVNGGKVSYLRLL